MQIEFISSRFDEAKQRRKSFGFVVNLHLDRIIPHITSMVFEPISVFACFLNTNVLAETILNCFLVVIKKR